MIQLTNGIGIDDFVLGVDVNITAFIFALLNGQ